MDAHQAFEATGRPATRSSGVSPPRLSGSCFALFAYDVGFQIDVEGARALLSDSSPYRVIRGRRPAPAWFDYETPPLRLLTEVGPLEVGGDSEGGPGDAAGVVRTQPTIEWMIYEFGAVLVTYRVPFDGSLEGLIELSRTLDDAPTLQRDSRARVEAMLESMRGAVERPGIKPLVEDYVVFVVDDWPEGTSPGAMLAELGDDLARVLQAEPGAISPQQVERTLASRMSYSPDDLTVVDWNGALVFDRDAGDVVAVLQHANVELLELRVLDRQLDALLSDADEMLAQFFRRRVWPSFRQDRMLRTFAAVHTDAAVMFEGVNNAIKLLGNQYLARLYRMGAGALDLPAWDSSILRKLAAADSVYQKMADTSAAQRMETLEVIIVLLIALSIVLMFVPGAGH